MIASSEPRSERHVLPNVEGMTMEDARLALGRLGLTQVSLHYCESYESDFTVIGQHPNAGEIVEATTPIKLRVARQSLVDFLPQIFQQPEDERTSFLKNYLYIVQSLHDRVSARLDSVHELFDPRSTQPEFLPWLASWLAITLSPDWEDLERRKMLRAATELFPHRGTARAIEAFVRIYTGADVEVLENRWPFSGFRIGSRSTVGADTVILPPMNLAHCFVVRIDRSPDSVSDEEIVKIHQIIGNQKPAHTSYFLAFGDTVDSGPMDVFMEVGAGAAIGVGSDVAVSAEIAETAESTDASEEAEAPAAEKPTARKTQARKKPAKAEAKASGATREATKKTAAKKRTSSKTKPSRTKKPATKRSKTKE